MHQAGWERIVLAFSIGCHSVLLWRLWAEKLAKVYLFLTLFLAAEMLQSFAVLPLRQDADLYLWSYVISTPILWVVAYLVVLELYRLTLEEYPGIASVGRKAVTWCMGLAIAISAVYAIPDLRTISASHILRIYVIVERSIVLGLLLFLVLIQLFLFHYKLPLSRNRIVYATGYALYFGIGIAQDIIWTALGVRVADYMTLWIVAVAGMILLAGAVLLNQEGEAKVILKPVDVDSDRARLQQQLADMNRMLSRAARGRG
ncbi:MAG: hypothetical protein ABSG41_04935 [Bryobacteraceae bacterium]|jgi:hypothetical protein